MTELMTLLAYKKTYSLYLYGNGYSMVIVWLKYSVSF